MAIGVVAGAVFPQLPKLLEAFSFGTISVPIAVGLLWMMCPPLPIRLRANSFCVKLGFSCLSVSLSENSGLM